MISIFKGFTKVQFVYRSCQLDSGRNQTLNITHRARCKEDDSNLITEPTEAQLHRPASSNHHHQTSGAFIIVKSSTEQDRHHNQERRPSGGAVAQHMFSNIRSFLKI